MIGSPSSAGGEASSVQVQVTKTIQDALNYTKATLSTTDALASAADSVGVCCLPHSHECIEKLLFVYLPEK